MLGYHIKHQLLLKKIRSFLWRKRLLWQQESPANTPHILALAAHISKTNLVTPILYFCNAISMPEWNFLQSFKKFCAADLNNWKFKVVLNPLHRIIFNFAESFILACWSLLCNNKLGSPSSFLRYEQLKPKYRMFLQGFPVSMVTCYATKMTASCSAIIGVSHGTITLLLHDKVL